ncbi:MAG TPA: signal peptidase I [Candidatus Dormibacteraeota bacterium]|nr:signal peptidase I [Candidatus Dormibacteraeota bacterium]
MTRLLNGRRLLSLILEIALLCILLFAFFVRTPQVSGRSMAPGISSGEYVLIDTLAYRFSRPARGDIVAFRRSDDPSAGPSIYIKRIIGLPGDRVAIRDGIVYVDAKRLSEPYVRYRDAHSFSPIVVPAGALYVLGDNRADSEDSRAFGCIPETAVIGRALAGIWPPQALRGL